MIHYIKRKGDILVIFIVISSILGTLSSYFSVYLLLTFMENKYAEKSDWIVLLGVAVIAVALWYWFSIELESYRVQELLV